MTDVAMVMLNNTVLGGAERRFAQMYERLRERNVTIALAINESLLARLVRAGVLPSNRMPEFVMKEPFGRLAARLIRLPKTLAFWLRKLDYALGCVSVGWWILRDRPKVLHLILGGVYVAAPLQCLRAAPPAVVSVVCPSLKAMVGSRMGLYLYRWSLRRARVVDALTEHIRIELQAEGVQPERVRVSAGSCVDTGRFQAAPAKQPWVVFAGRLVEEKNPALFVHACALAHDRFPSARFFVLGDGPLRGTIEELVKSYKLESCTQVGWSHRIESALSEALVFVSLQRMDNYPSQALLEAMACETAVVATDVGLTSRLVDHSVGYRVEATPVAVAQAVEDLLASPEEAIRMGKQGRQRVMQQHSMEAYVDYLESLYEQASGVNVAADRRNRKAPLASART